jgi:hypothetical protein
VPQSGSISSVPAPSSAPYSKPTATSFACASSVRWVWTTSFGRRVVPEVVNSRQGLSGAASSWARGATEASSAAKGVTPRPSIAAAPAAASSS